MLQRKKRPTKRGRRVSFESLEARNLLTTLVASGAGDYLVKLANQGTEDPADDVIQLFKNNVLLDQGLAVEVTSISITGGLNTSDSLTVDFSDGNPIPAGGVSFDGLAGSGTDTVTLAGGDHTDAAYTYTSLKVGSATLDGSVVTFAGLESLNNTGASDNATFVLTADADNVILSELAGGELRLDGATIATTTINKPSASVTVTGGSTDTVTVGGALSLNLGAADLSLTGNSINLNRSLTTSGDVVTNGTGTFASLAGMEIHAGGIVDLQHTGTIHLRGAISGTYVSLTSHAASTNAIQGLNAHTLTATNLSLTATAGGINYGLGHLNATNDITLAAAVAEIASAAINLKTLTAGGDFSATGGGDFSTAPDASFDVEGSIFVHHGGTLTLRGSMEAAAIDLRSRSTGNSAIWAVPAVATLKATGGDVSLTATQGGINYGISSLTASNDVLLSAVGNVSVKLVDAGNNFTAFGNEFDSSEDGNATADGTIDLDFAGDIQLRAPMTAGTIEMSAGSVSSNAIWAITATTELKATAGDVVLNSTSGGINFGSATLTASHNVDLTAATSVNTRFVSAGQDFLSEGTAFDSSTGSVIEALGQININHTGQVELRGPMTGESVSITANSSSNDAIIAVNVPTVVTSTGGDITLNSNSGGINFGVGTLVASENIKLTAVTNVQTLNVTAGGDFTSEGGQFDSQTGAVIEADGLINLDHTGQVILRGTMEGASVSITSDSISGNAIWGTTAASIITSTVGDITLNSTTGGINFSLATLDAHGNVGLTAATSVNTKMISAGGSFTSQGAQFDSQTGSIIAADGPVSLNHTGQVIVRGTITGESIDVTSSSVSGSAIWLTNAAATFQSTGGDVTLAAVAGGVNLQGDITVVGGEYSSSGLTTLTQTAGRTIDTNGGIARFDHDGLVTIGGQLSTDGGALHINVKLESANPGSIRFTQTSGNIEFAPGSVLYIDPSAIDITAGPPLKFFNVVRAAAGDILGLANVDIESGPDLDGNPTAFTGQIITSGAAEILQVKGIEASPIIASGAGNYRLVLNPYGAGTEDDQIELYRNAVLIASQLYIGTTYVQVTGAVGSSDSLEIDYSGGNPIPLDQVFFNGLAGAGTDSLSITSGNHTTTTYNYQTAKSGQIDIDGGQINYSELEQPLTNTSTTVDAIFNLPAGGTTATLRELSANVSELNATAIMQTIFNDPTGSLVILGDGNDSITVGGTSTYALDTASLALTAQNLTFARGATAGGTGIDLNALGTTSTAVRFTAAGPLTATSGEIEINSAGGIAFSLATMNAAQGDITLSAAGAVALGQTTADGSFNSVGQGTFELTTAGPLTAGGDVNLSVAEFPRSAMQPGSRRTSGGVF